MGAKTWMLVYADSNARELLAKSPVLDRNATSRLANLLFPKERLEPLDDGSLDYTCPPDDEIHIGCFPGVSVVAAAEFGIDNPTQLPAHFLKTPGSRIIYLHAMHSVVDWFAFAIWRDGQLERALSLSPDSGILEDIGPKLPFEQPYWDSKHPAVDPEDEEEPAYPFPFHPLELGEAALLEFFGYQIEGHPNDWLFEPETIPLVRYKRKKSRWRLW